MRSSNRLHVITVNCDRGEDQAKLEPHRNSALHAKTYGFRVENLNIQLNHQCMHSCPMKSYVVHQIPRYLLGRHTVTS